MRRLLLVYNPRSSRFADVKKDVLAKAHQLKGYLVGKYEVARTDVDHNAKALAKLLQDNDLVVAAGGDATATIAVNGILQSNKDVALAVLPYGNFNDLSRTLGTKTFQDIFSRKTRMVKFYPLEISVNQQFFRFATCYITIGMTAEAVKIYDAPQLRKILKTRFGRTIGSYCSIAAWYFRHRHQKIFLPDFSLNGVKQANHTSDYFAINGRSMARVMRGSSDYHHRKTFHSSTNRLTSFWRLFVFMLRSILFHVPGTTTQQDILNFFAPTTIKIQAEGEYKTFQQVTTVSIKRSEKSLKVLQY